MKRMFTIETTKSKVQVINRKRTVVTEPMVLQVEVLIEGKLINLRYGYKEWTTKHKEGFDSAIPGQAYTMHHSIKPQEGDVWRFGERTFTVGKCSGFVVYTAPLLENGKQVATIKFEDYYKD